MTFDFKTLAGKRGSLYYTNLSNHFQLGSVLFEVVEDANDGYRSSMDEVKIVTTNAPKSQLLGEVEIMNIDEDGVNGFSLRDTGDGHIWLTFGTNYTDDYYPYFVFDWTPKPSPQDISEKIK